MSVEFWKRSPITGRKYNYFSEDNIRILNFEQAFFYCEEKGIVPLDIVLTDDKKRQGKKVIIFIFSKLESQEAYSDWCERNKNKIDN